MYPPKIQHIIVAPLLSPELPRGAAQCTVKQTVQLVLCYVFKCSKPPAAAFNGDENHQSALNIVFKELMCSCELSFRDT